MEESNERSQGEKEEEQDAYVLKGIELRCFNNIPPCVLLIGWVCQITLNPKEARYE